MISFANLTLVLSFCFAIYWFYRSKRRNLPPGPWAFPVVGSVLSLGETPYLTFQKWAKRYGPLIHTKFGFTDVLIIDDAKLIRAAFSEPVFNGRVNSKVFSIVSNGKRGILNSEGVEWSEQRRFVVRALRDFGFGKQSMESFIMDEVRDYLKWMTENEGLPTQMDNRFILATVNSLWTLLAGERHEQDDPIINEIIEKANTAFTAATKSNSLIFFLPQFLDILPQQLQERFLGLENFKPFINLFKDAVDAHIKNPVDETNPRDLIDVYLNEVRKTEDSKSSFFKERGYQSLVSVVGDLYGAGQATTSSTLTFAVLYLVRFPHVQAKLQQELDAVIGKNRLPTLSDKAKLPYTEALMMEILRYSTITPLGLLHEAMADTTFNGYAVKKGTTVVANIYSVHFSSDIWGDPENFRPERHLTPDGKNVIKSENILSFGTGKRQCIGESLARDTFFLFLTSIFQRFEISSDPANPEPTLEVESTFFRDAKKFFVVFKDRIE